MSDMPMMKLKPYPVCRCDLAGVDHDEKLHQVVIDFAAARLNNVNVLTSDRLANLDAVEKKFTSVNKYRVSRGFLQWGVGRPLNVACQNGR